METISNSKCRKILNDDVTFVHCSICGNFRNINAFPHRKSKHHQKRLSSKLRKIAFHLGQKKKKQIVHDEGWPERDFKRLCHFCAESYEVHFKDGEFVVEDLGALYHHAGSPHIKSVEAFLNSHFSKEKPEKYCIPKAELDSILKGVAEAKIKYLQKMDLLNDMIVNQIKTTEEERKKLVLDELQAQPSCSTHEEQNLAHEAETRREGFQSQYLSNSWKNETEVKVPPWLEDAADNSVVNSGYVPPAPVIGPTLDTLMKHVESQKKKGLSQNRVGANFQHAIQASSKWRPSFHGTFNRRRRKERRGKFKPGNKEMGY